MTPTLRVVPRFKIGELRNGQDLVRQFKNRALALFEVKSGVRGRADDLHSERSHTLTSGFQRASRTGRLAYQDRGTFAGP